MELPNLNELSNTAAATVTGALAGVAWWFHVRRLKNRDVVDGEVTKSLDFVLNHLRKQIDAQTARIDKLENENSELRLQLATCLERHP